MNAWIWLAFAIFFEVAGTSSLKLSYGFTRLIPSGLAISFYLVSFFALAEALKGLDLCIAYAVWAGLGVALVTLVGVFVFKESMDVIRALSILLIIIGVIGLRVSCYHPYSQ